jgi:hypothetical protein
MVNLSNPGYQPKHGDKIEITTISGIYRATIYDNYVSLIGDNSMIFRSLGLESFREKIGDYYCTSGGWPPAENIRQVLTIVNILESVKFIGILPDTSFTRMIMRGITHTKQYQLW